MTISKLGYCLKKPLLYALSTGEFWDDECISKKTRRSVGQYSDEGETLYGIFTN